MEPVLHKILVVGGNGFVGSAVCKAALARGMQVTSISQSGTPYKTPKGHSPAWTSKVEWKAADALRPETYAHLLPGVTAVVHTLGTLLEDTRYKSALKDGNLPALFGALASNITRRGPTSNPLAGPEVKQSTYDTLNRDAALRVCEAFLASPPSVPVEGPRPFVYVSAEDVFRPVIPARYIESKREAEVALESMIATNPGYRGVYVRPSLIYHPHFRPLTTPIAALLDLSATLHANVPRGIPTPSGVLLSLASAFPPTTPSTTPSPFESMAGALTIPPIHVDHVAEAICMAVDPRRSDLRGVLSVQDMRELIGWSKKGQSQTSASAQQGV